MRILPLLLLLLCSAAQAAGLDDARRLAAAGAPELAVMTLEGDGSAAALEERVVLLGRLKRDGEVRALAGALPGEASPAARLAIAGALLAEGEGPAARHQLGLALWGGAAPEEARAARLRVIDSYLAQGRAGEAYLAMLRYRQDYRLAPGEAARFARALVVAGRGVEALAWLDDLGNDEGMKRLVRLSGGTLAPRAAAEGARRALAGGGGRKSVTLGREARRDAWRTLLLAAEREDDQPARVEALEHLADLEAAPPDALLAAYRTLAEATANRLQLLAGDDAAWLASALEQGTVAPVAGRALLAVLNRDGQNEETRATAHAQLIASLTRDGLTGAALAEAGEPARLPAALRHTLGDAAFRRGDWVRAAALWDGLPAPAVQPPEAWALRRIQAWVGAGQPWSALPDTTSLSTLRPLDGRRAEALAAAAQLLDAAGQTDQADTLFAALAQGGAQVPPRLPVLGLEEATRLLLTAPPTVADPLAFQNRYAAAVALARAGLREDARLQYRLLAKASQDPALKDSLRFLGGQP